MNRFLEQARAALHEYRSREDGADTAVVALPVQVLLHFYRLAANSLQSSMRQVVTVHSESWDPESFDNMLWRQVARIGRRVSRLYILPHAGIAPELISRHLSLDREAGVSVGCVVLSRLPADVQLAATRGISILDDNAVLLPSERSDSSGPPTHWVVTARESDVRAAQRICDQLWDLTATSDLGHGKFDLEEPLVLSADIIHGVASVLCTADHVDPTSCAWYHSVWQYLRLLNMVSTPTWHDAFYRTHISAGLQHSPSHVLVSGTADYSMYAYVCDASRATGTTPAISVLDLCETPLFACRWYAKRQGLSLETLHEDIFCQRVMPSGSLDLICADAFLTRFPLDQAAVILQIWRGLLRPGGVVVTTVRIHDSTPPARDTEKLVLDFRSRATQRAIRWRPFIHVTPERLGQLAEAYARRMKSVVLGDVDHICTMFAGAGLEVAHHELATVPGELMPSRYLRIVARRA